METELPSIISSQHSPSNSNVGSRRESQDCFTKLPTIPLNTCDVTQSGQSLKTRRPNLGISPYEMKAGDPLKYFIAGYRGYVPGCRFLTGSTYSNLTREALNDFYYAQKYVKEKEKTRFSYSQPVAPPIPREGSNMRDSPRIYPVTSGMIPRYSGHIPGHQFRLGKTFGAITINPKKAMLSV